MTRAKGSAARRAASKVAGLSRDRSPDDPELLDARRDLAEAKLEAAIRATLAAAPPISDAQRRRLADLLAPAVAATAAARTGGENA